MILEEDGELKVHGLLGRDRATGKFHLDEARTLQQFWDMARGLNLNRDTIIGHNVLDFDLPFIIKRSVVFSVRPSIQIPFARWRRHPIFDTMWEWSCWRHRVALNDVARALKVPCPKSQEMDGGMIYDAWREGRDEEIALYCMRDVECAREVYYRLNFEVPPPIVSYETKAKMAVATESWLKPAQV